MRTTILAGLALASLAAVPARADARPAAALLPSAAAAEAVQDGGVRVWLDGNRDLLYPHDRIRVRASTDRGGYLAVFHIDTNGDLDVLFPRSEWDDGWVDANRTLSLSTRGGWDYLRVNGGPGVGYVFAVALDEPLELWRLRDLYRPRQAGWDPARTVYGDPFYAMDEIVRAVVPEWAAGYESIDHYTYHVGRRYTHPRYACYDGYGDWYHSRVSYWPSCDRVRIILVNRPYYYDTYRWRGSRRYYYDRYYTTVVRQNRPLHGYKERTDSYAPPARTAERRPQPAGAGSASPSGGGTGARVARPTPSGSGPATSPARGSDDRPAAGGGGRDSRDGARVSRPSAGSREQAAPPRGSAPSRRDPAESPRSRPSDDGGARSAPAARPRAGEPSSAGGFVARARQEQERQQDPQERRQEDRPVQSSRERPTFQRRGSSSAPAAEPTRRSEPRRESPPPRREAPPQRQRESSPPPRQRESSPPPQRSSEPRQRESSPPSRDAGGGSTRPSASPSFSRPGG